MSVPKCKKKASKPKYNKQWVESLNPKEQKALCEAMENILGEHLKDECTMNATEVCGKVYNYAFLRIGYTEDEMYRVQTEINKIEQEFRDGVSTWDDIDDYLLAHGIEVDRENGGIVVKE